MIERRAREACSPLKVHLNGRSRGKEVWWVSAAVSASVAGSLRRSSEEREKAGVVQRSWKSKALGAAVQAPCCGGRSPCGGRLEIQSGKKGV